MGCYANQEFTGGHVIVYTYGTLLYLFIVDVLKAPDVHVKGVTAGNRDQLNTSAMRLPK